MKKVSVEERRIYPRLYRQLPLRLALEDFEIESETKNISASGLYCRVKKPFDLMTKLRMAIMLPLKGKDKLLTKKIVCSGVVVRTEVDLTGANHIAIFFTDIKKDDQDKISRYVKENI